MQHRIIQSALIAAILLLSASQSLAVDTKPATAGETKAMSGAKAGEKGAKASAKVKLVDINSAGKAELKKLPGISDAEADKIIAGRPYGSKAHLTTRDIVSREVYENLKTLVIAKQKQNPMAKPSQK
jgi:DNA uptake protein ComE-like DNA-binding protein